MSYSSTIHVYTSSGSPATGVRVSLGFGGFFGGVPRDFYTDSHGVAQVDHSSRGEATVTRR